MGNKMLDSQYLEAMAKWFEDMDQMGMLKNMSAIEIVSRLLSIAEKLRLLESHEHMISGNKIIDNKGCDKCMTHKVMGPKRFTCPECGQRWKLASVYPGAYWEPVA